MKRLFPNWWLDGSIQVQDGEKGLEVTCAMLRELEELTKTLGSQLIVFLEYHDGSFSSTAVEGKVRRVWNCLSDPAPRVFDLKPALSELKAKDVSRYGELNMPRQRWALMTAEGNRFVALEILKIRTHGSTQVDRGVLRRHTKLAWECASPV
jgi:hypothetical protein